MASTRGRCAAARRSESWMPSKWYCGSACALGFHGRLVAEDHLAVDDRGALAVAGAEVEADAAAVQVPAERRGGLALLRSGVEGGALDRHGPAVDALAHEVVVEGARAFGRVDAAQVFGDARLARRR